jgi:Flp pilus assembly protein TadD
MRELLYGRSIWRLVAKVQFVDNPLAHAPAVTRVLTALKIQVEYLWLIVWPHPLCADYSYNSVPLVSHFTNSSVLISLGVLILLIVIAANSFLRRRRLWFGIFFYAVAILPVANILTVIGSIKAERFLYLPSFGLSFVVAVGTAQLITADWFGLARSQRIRIVGAGVLVVLLAGLVATLQRNLIWQNERTLWQSVVSIAPDNLKAQLQIGRQALTNRDLPRAIAAFRSAHEIDSDSEDAAINLSAALLQDRQYAEAASVLEQSVRRNPGRAALHLNLGLADVAIGRAASGIDELRRACELEPSNPQMRFNLALALSKSGDPQSAIAEYHRTVDADAAYAEAWNGLGAALLKLHRNEEARTALQRALMLRPDFSEAIYNMTLLDAPR